ncbi:MAG: rhomboid family intramembrane serine protease, partial [Leptospiraceae bacterium]|nr:rhomboid family intramembrane serine protease [Leptospiraceae bacterium]
MLNSTPFFTRNLLIWNGIAFIFINILLFILAGEKGVFHAFQFLGLSRPAFLEGALWQPVTSMFIHGGFAHLLMNMLGLWSIGSLLERNLGGKNFLKLYLFSGLIGATFVILFQNSAMPTVGASGAITGLLGALAILYPETTLLLFIFPVKARTAAILLGVVSFIFAFDPSGQISHLGHLGGLIGGVL